MSSSPLVTMHATPITTRSTDVLFPFDSKALTTGAVARAKRDQWLYTQVNGRRVAHAESVKIAVES